MPTPRTYIVRNERGYAVMHDGAPLTADGRTLADCFAVAARHKLHLTDQIYVAPLGRFVQLAIARKPIAALIDDELAAIKCQLSPENLHCDGERSPAEARRIGNKLRSRRAALRLTRQKLPQAA